LTDIEGLAEVGGGEGDGGTLGDCSRREKVSRGKRDVGKKGKRRTGERITGDTFDLDAGGLVLEDDGALDDQLELIVAVCVFVEGTEKGSVSSLPIVA
jgi:hypothetical protein